MFDTWLSAVREFLASLSKQQAKERRADEERAEWNAHFIGITARRMSAAPKIDLGVPDGGDLADGTLSSLDPEPLLIRLGSRPKECAVCGVEVEESKRLAVSIEPRFANGFGFLKSVWVHSRCFERCEESGERRSIPW